MSILLNMIAACRRVLVVLRYYICDDTVMNRRNEESAAQNCTNSAVLVSLVSDGRSLRLFVGKAVGGAHW